MYYRSARNRHQSGVYQRLRWALTIAGIMSMGNIIFIVYQNTDYPLESTGNGFQDNNALFQRVAAAPNVVHVIVHIRGDTLNHNVVLDLDRTVRAVHGVRSVRIHKDRQHIMLVAYQPDSTTSQTILRTIAQRGLQAELVDM